MKTFISNFIESLKKTSEAQDKYRALQRHLDSMPVGYPATSSGVELRLLRSIFSAEEAEVALLLDWNPRTFSELFKKAKDKGYTEEKFRALMDSMSDKGGVFTRMIGKEKHYSLFSMITGMYDLQWNKLTANTVLDLREYVTKKMAMEYYTAEARQMRVIPVQKSVSPQLAVAAYDDIREIVDRTKEQMSVVDCICRHGKDLIGQPCKKTDRRDVCIFFRDYHNFTKAHGWGSRISKKEAFNILNQNEKEGLILMPSTMQEPEFVCSCCSCCCGIQEMVTMFPRPVDFVESNYRASLNPVTCTGCGVCEKRCNLNAIKLENKKAVSIDEKRCVGCGLCAVTCKSGSLKLVRKEKQFVPPKDHYALLDLIDKNKKSPFGKASLMMKAMMGFKV